MKSDYTAYIHKNGLLQVKRCPFGEDLIDTASPFVVKHLGRVTAESIEQARVKFEEIVSCETKEEL